MLTEKTLRKWQAMPLELKIKKTKMRIREMLKNYDMYISYSGGKDSTVLMDLVKEVAREEFGIDVPAVFVNTGLEYRSLREFATKHADVVVKPEMGFKEVIITFGYPIISKTQSRYIEDMRNPNVCDKTKQIRLNGSKEGYFKISDKWKHLIDSDFKISNKCCYYMKKKPFKRYGKESGRHPFIGTMAQESNMRKTKWIKHGCNMTDDKIQSMPLSFWTPSDILEYIDKNNLKLPSVYGDIILQDGNYTTTGVKRTGCVYCMYGVHNEPYHNNRFVDLYHRDKQLYDYIIGGGEYVDGWWQPNSEGLGLGHVLDEYGINYDPDYKEWIVAEKDGVKYYSFDTTVKSIGSDIFSPYAIKKCLRGDQGKHRGYTFNRIDSSNVDINNLENIGGRIYKEK